MAQHRPTMMDPPIEDLLDKVVLTEDGSYQERAKD